MLSKALQMLLYTVSLLMFCSYFLALIIFRCTRKYVECLELVLAEKAKPMTENSCASEIMGGL